MEGMVRADPEFYAGKKVLVTGHTGFKGSWLCRILKLLGAEVYGYSLDPPTDPSLYDIAGIGGQVHSRIADIRDYDELSRFYADASPDIVLHLAAQPIVREGYRIPRETYESNVMGTVNILECIRTHPCARSFLNVTTDKVYDNNDSDRFYSEDDRLDGYDPYSNSKSCSELVTHSYRRSFLEQAGVAVSTARAGNVIGGGDFAKDRLVPDCVRAAVAGKDVVLRNPNSIRPYQHVLEPLYSYLTVAAAQYADPELAGSYNIGPDREDCITSGELADGFCRIWGKGLKWRAEDDNGPHEASFLKLDNSLLRKVFGISPLWHSPEAVARTVEWTKVWADGGDVLACMDSQIKEYFSGRGINL